MRRRLFRIVVVCFVLAVATTIAVAWSFAIWIDPLHVKQRGTPVLTGSTCGTLGGVDAPFGYWTVSVYERRGACLVESMWSDPKMPNPGETPMLSVFSSLPQTADAHVPDWAPFIRPPEQSTTSDEDHTRAVYSFGWPMHAMWWARDCDTQTRHWLPPRYRYSIKLPNRKGGVERDNDRALPVGIIWSGFAVNMLAYFGALFVPTALYKIARHGRRWHRERRGCCVKCGYPIGVSPVCTECGAELRLMTNQSDRIGSK
jgi:hypothetical protein